MTEIPNNKDTQIQHLKGNVLVSKITRLDPQFSHLGEPISGDALRSEFLDGIEVARNAVDGPYVTSASLDEIAQQVQSADWENLESLRELDEYLRILLHMPKRVRA